MDDSELCDREKIMSCSTMKRIKEEDAMRKMALMINEVRKFKEENGDEIRKFLEYEERKKIYQNKNEEFRKLSINQSKWIRMSYEERRKVIERQQQLKEDMDELRKRMKCERTISGIEKILFKEEIINEIKRMIDGVRTIGRYETTYKEIINGMEDRNIMIYEEVMKIMMELGYRVERNEINRMKIGYYDEKEVEVEWKITISM